MDLNCINGSTIEVPAIYFTVKQNTRTKRHPIIQQLFKVVGDHRKSQSNARNSKHFSQKACFLFRNKYLLLPEKALSTLQHVSVCMCAGSLKALSHEARSIT